MDQPDTDLNWIKSSLSYSNGNCFEVAWHKGAECGKIHVRDSKDPEGPQLRFTLAEWRAFVGGVRAGDFDHAIP